MKEEEVMKKVLKPLINDVENCRTAKDAIEIVKKLEKLIRKRTKMSKLKTLKPIQEYANDRIDTITEEPCFFGVNDALDIFSEELIKEAKKWIKELNKTLERACKKQEDGYYNDAELEIEGVTYTASAFADDEAQPIIGFINQFFNLEGNEEGCKKESQEGKRRIRELLEERESHWRNKNE